MAENMEPESKGECSPFPKRRAKACSCMLHFWPVAPFRCSCIYLLGTVTVDPIASADRPTAMKAAFGVVPLALAAVAVAYGPDALKDCGQGHVWVHGT